MKDSDDVAWYFMHIPKTAGTSTIAWLHSLGRFTACPHGLWSLLLAEDRASLSRYDLFCGHFYRYLAAYLGRPLATFTFIRNPLDRAYSHYRHVARDTHHYFHARAKEQGSFGAFLRDPVTQPLVRNFQTRALAAMFDPVAVQSAVSHEGKYALERHLETVASGLSDEDELALAKDGLRRCVFVGIAERMKESTALLARVLEVEVERGPEWLNRDDGPPAQLTPEEWRLATELNRNDLRLYEYALTLFHRYRDAGRPSA